MMKVELPENEELAGKLIDADAAQKRKRMEIGLMGLLFGSQQEKPGNVAGFALILSTVMMAVIMFVPDTSAAAEIRGELLTLFGAVFTATLGYLFGYRSS